MAPDNIVVADTGHLADHLLMVSLASLHASYQARHLNTEVVGRLAQSLKEVGLIQAITVRPNIIIKGSITEDGYRIVAGHHRVAAARALGWTEIPAFVLDADISDMAAEMVEIDENLVRCELTPAQRAGAIKWRKAIWELLHPEQTSGTTCPTLGGRGNTGFAAETAVISGESKRDVNRHVARAEALGDDINIVVGTSLDKGTELDALKRLPADQRKNLILRAASGEKVSAKTTLKVNPEAPPPLPRGSRKLVPVPRADMNHALNALNKSLTATRAFLEATRGYPMARRSEIAALTKKLIAAVAALDHLVETSEL